VKFFTIKPCQTCGVTRVKPPTPVLMTKSFVQLVEAILSKLLNQKTSLPHRLLRQSTWDQWYASPAACQQRESNGYESTPLFRKRANVNLR